ncbi:unnamed protein product [Effrenium voratum]|nr:unnamed protein product [Effrenium voratum]
MDVPSSGLLLVAKTYGCYFELRMQLQTGQLLREYAVLCRGLLPRARAVAARVAAPSAGRGDQSSVAPQGKVALTRLKVLGYYMHSASSLCLVAVQLGTGRMHQIRLHTAHIGHATVMDGKYAASETTMEDGSWCSRNFLHRYRLAFVAAGLNTAAAIDVGFKATQIPCEHRKGDSTSATFGLQRAKGD